MTPAKINDASPRMPRRVFLAALCSAAVSGAAVYLAASGLVTTPATAAFRFARGVSLAPGEEQRLRAHLTEALRDDRIMVTIVGHSGTAGDASANQDLSEARAAFVADTATAMGIDAGRIDFVGVGGAAPLARPADITDRAWQADLARVDVTLQVRR